MITTAYDLLAGHPFLHGMSRQHLDRLALWGRRSSFHAGTRIFSEGGVADRFWLIRDGAVELDTEVPGRGRVVVETLGGGSVLGWSWLFPPYRWHFGATAVEPTLTVELDGKGIYRLCAEDPALGFELTAGSFRWSSSAYKPPGPAFSTCDGNSNGNGVPRRGRGPRCRPVRVSFRPPRGSSAIR